MRRLKGCLLLPTIFNILLERIITDALEDHEGTVMFRDKTITNFRFAADIDGFEGEEEVGGQHEEMDRPGVRQVPEGSEEQGKMEKTGCEIIFGVPTTLAVKG